MRNKIVQRAMAGVMSAAVMAGAMTGCGRETKPVSEAPNEIFGMQAKQAMQKIVSRLSGEEYTIKEKDIPQRDEPYIAAISSVIRKDGGLQNIYIYICDEDGDGDCDAIMYWGVSHDHREKADSGDMTPYLKGMEGVLAAIDPGREKEIVQKVSQDGKVREQDAAFIGDGVEYKYMCEKLKDTRYRYDVKLILYPPGKGYAAHLNEIEWETGVLKSVYEWIENGMSHDEVEDRADGLYGAERSREVKDGKTVAVYAYPYSYEIKSNGKNIWMEAEVHITYENDKVIAKELVGVEEGDATSAAAS